MGIDIHTLNFLRFAAKKQIFGSVATIGRQQLHVPTDTLHRIMKLDSGFGYGSYCEEFLKEHFGAANVDSFDNSDYENATHIADMNSPIAIHNQYDTVIDGGCLEHVYNAPQALKNVSQMCADGGQILHVLPANNFCGHGFWQFSPELFFSLYSEANGYLETQVFLADLAQVDVWYEVKKPQHGERANATSSTPLYVLARTRKLSTFSHENVQQSDYVYVWNGGQAPSATDATDALSPAQQIKSAIKRSPFGLAAHLLHKLWMKVETPPTALSAKNPHLIKRAVSSMV